VRLTVFGATGRTGKLVVEQALAAGHEVTALARNPAAVPERDRLTVQQGDVLDPAAVERAVAGNDAVVSALGVADRKPTTVFSEGVGNMLRAMKATGTTRIVALSADGVEENPNVNLGQRLVTKLVVARIFRSRWEDMLRMERELAGSDADWTAIRAPGLKDGQRTGKYRISNGAPIKDSSRISRADLADYILAHLDDTAAYRQIVGVSY
jgi:putative NADH-flavin reductase